VAQIEVTEESIRELVHDAVFERGVLLAGRVSGLSFSGARVRAVVDGVPVAVPLMTGPLMTGRQLEAECACRDPAPCAHAVGALLAWVRAAPQDEPGPHDDEAAQLLGEFEEALAEQELDADYLDELVDDIEDLLDSEPAATRDLADRVLNLLEARLPEEPDGDATGLLERIEELWLEARQVAGPPGRADIALPMRKPRRADSP
jgi:uncharacterized Zn finger protein